MANILCTGGCGFIGSHLVDRLVKDGHRVVVIDNLSTGSMENIKHHDIGGFYRGNDVEYINLDLSKSVAEGILDLLVKTREISVVYHLAAQINLRSSIEDPVNDALNNIVATIKVAKVANKNGARLIFTSTGGAIYSSKSPKPTREVGKIDPLSPYGQAKKSCEEYIKLLTKDYIIFRLANVYGPRQNPKGEAGVISIFIDAIRKNEEVKIFGNGTQTRDFIYVEDVVNLLALAANPNALSPDGLPLEWTHKIYNVGTGAETSVNEILELVSSSMKTKTNPTYFKKNPGELMRSCLSIDRTRLVGWEPMTPIGVGIKKTVDSFINEDGDD